MGSGSRVVLVIVQLGFIMLFASLLFPNAPQLPTVTAPQFNNPFDRTLTIVAGFSTPWDGIYSLNSSAVYAVSNEIGTPSCTNATMYFCVVDPNGIDGNTTYIHIGSGLYSLRLNLTGQFGIGKVRDAIVKAFCRTVGPQLNRTYSVLSTEASGQNGTFFLDNYGENTFCSTNPFFSETVLHLSPVAGTGPFDLSANTNGPNLRIDITGDVLEITKLEVTLFITGQTTSCGGSDFFGTLGCQIGAFFSNIGNWALFVFEGIKFILSWAGAFVVTMSGLFTLLIWLYAIPGMPFIPQAILSGWITASIAYVIYVIAALIRGAAVGD